MSIEAIFGAIFGVGGVGAITVIVTAYRRIKRGSIDDDDSIIRRLYEEVKRLRERAELAEAREDQTAKQLDLETQRRRHADEFNWLLKSTIVQMGGHVPHEPPPGYHHPTAPPAEGEQ